MLAVERRAEIEEIINRDKSVLVADLARLFGVTPETIRGDLYKLEKQGVLLRTYGGATLLSGSGSGLGVTERDVVNAEAKRRIGARAATMIRNGETIFLDASTSSLYLARSLKETRALTVITNSEKVISELADRDNISLICTGGRLNTRNMSYVGRFTERMIKENFAANKVFFSCRGVTPARGVVDVSEDEAEIKRAMLDAADSAVLLCDRSKLGETGIPIIAPIERVDALITDVRPDAEWTRAFEENDVKVITV